jgi:hypothetical protein
MRSTRRTSERTSVLLKTQRNRAVRLRTRIKTLCTSEIHMHLKIDADALNRRWRRFCFRRTIYIYQRQWRQCAGKSACVYVICSVKNKIEDQTNLAHSASTYLTQTHAKLSKLNLGEGIIQEVLIHIYIYIWESYAQNHMRSIRRTTKRPSVLSKTQRNRAVILRTRIKTLWTSEIHINLKIDDGVAFVSVVQYIIPIKVSEGCVLVSAHASTLYAVWRIKSKPKQILLTLLPSTLT